MLGKYLDKLIEVVHNSDEVPDEVAGAINDVLAHADKTVPWYKALFFKNGSFSKTATFATIVNVLVIAFYALSLFKGLTLDFGSVSWTVPGFDAGAATAIMLIANGTYLGNNIIKKGGNGG